MQIISALVLISLAISFYYYKITNQSIDPRIIGARNLYKKYNAFAQQKKFDSVFWLMDTVEMIYEQVDHYKESYEIGVLYNNRATSYLTQAHDLEYIEKSSLKKDSLMDLAEIAVKKSIEYYSLWLDLYQDRSIVEIKTMISNDFSKGLENYTKNQNYKYLQNRAKELVEAQTETQGRVSVSYTNLGIVYQHKEKFKEAAKNYTIALEFWNKNFTAENNLKLLLGRPLKKGSIIEK